MPTTFPVIVQFRPEDGRETAAGVITDDPERHFCAVAGKPIVIARGVVLSARHHRVRITPDATAHPRGWSRDEAAFVAAFTNSAASQ